ncbi:hypothetical protein Bca52824_055546, partial [Brassica carinata]
YCAKVLFKVVPDMWLCEECRTSRGVIFINHDEASASNQQSDSESANLFIGSQVVLLDK